MSTNGKPGIVFAHGLWADGSCYSKVIPALQAEGYQVISTQNPLDTLEGDVAAVQRAIGRVNSPVILVGHSYAGTVITAAGFVQKRRPMPKCVTWFWTPLPCMQRPREPEKSPLWWKPAR